LVQELEDWPGAVKVGELETSVVCQGIAPPEKIPTADPPEPEMKRPLKVGQRPGEFPDETAFQLNA